MIDSSKNNADERSRANFVSVASSGNEAGSDRSSPDSFDIAIAEIPAIEGVNNYLEVDNYYINCDELSQFSIQQSLQETIQTDAGQAVVGMSADWAFAQEDDHNNDETSGCDEPEEVGQAHIMSSDNNSLRWDSGEPGRGGVTDDSASLEVSAITSVRSAFTLTNPNPVTMNKLHFSSLGLHGRQKEVDLLRGCFDRFVAKLAESERPSSVSDSNDARSSEVVFISGESGTGKTALAESIKERVASCDGTYITGKFDQNLREPYFGIISLFRELCGEILELRRSNSEKYQELCRSITSEVGGEIVLLTNIVPVLEEAIEIPFMSGAVADQGNKEAKERLKYSFLQFFRVFIRYFRHLVIVLDDLQWTDALSIELLDAIINDRDISIMFIGIYRSNEVDEAHYLSKTIRDMHSAKKKRWDLTEVSIGNLDVTICENILVQLLDVQPCAETMRLAAICHQRTAGNAFHLLAYLAMLQKQKLLVTLGKKTKRWTWDPDRIEQKTSVTSNVVELIKATISKQPQMFIDLLQLVACLGTSFEKDIAVCAFPHMHDGTDPSLAGKIVDELLSLAVQESFLDRRGESRFCWVHDSIQAAAMLQVSEEEMVAYKFKLGKVLIQNLDMKDVESNLFEIVNLLLSSDEECHEIEKMIFLDLCVKAAKKAVEFSSFESCVRYAEKGISLLSSDKWNKEREVSLELFSLVVEAHFSLANVDKMKFYGDEVLMQSALTELEKVRVHSCNISLVGGVMNKAREALDMSIAVLRKLGCKFPKNKLLQARIALSSLATTKLPTENDIANLPIMNDPARKACMKIMINGATYSHHCNDVFAFIMLITRAVQWTMKYGVDTYSSSAFALFGMIKKLTSYTKGAKFADRGFRLLDICADSKNVESRVTYLCWFMVYPFSKPIHSTLKHLLHGYKVGMEVGDVESAMWNVSMFICSSIVAGKALKPLAADCVVYIEQMKMLKQDYILHQSLPFAQGVLNMLGDAEDPLILSGSAMVEEEYLAMIESSEARVNSFLHLKIFKNIMCNFFGDFEQGAKLALERGDEYEKKNGSPLTMLDTLHQGISLYAMARKTKEKKYIKAAKKAKKRIAMWLKKGNINVTHYIPFLEAEEAALEGNVDEAKRLYTWAISLASSSGFPHNAAFPSERFAEYLLHDLKDEDRAGEYFQDSIKYYTDWGSDYKADLLKQNYSHLWDNKIPAGISVNHSSLTVDESGGNATQDTSDPSSAAPPIGAERVLVTAIAEDIPKKHSVNTNNNALDFWGDDKHGRGGDNKDSASVDISAITTPSTKLRDGSLRDRAADHISTNMDEVIRIGDKTDEVTRCSNSRQSSLIASRDLLLEEYRTQLGNGDMNSVAFQISLRCYQNWPSYHPLVDVQSELEASVSALKKINMKSHERCLQAYLLVVKRLRNLASTDETNNGFKELLKAVEPNSNVFHTVRMMQLELIVLFQDWKGVMFCLAESPDTRKAYQGMNVSVRGMFLEALVSLKTSKYTTSWLARRKGKRKAIKTLRRLNGLVEQGNDNVRHYMHILLAECYVLEGNARAAENNFKAAMSIAELLGFLHDKALAHELSSSWYKERGKDYWTDFHLECAQNLYRDWGANSKIEPS